MIAQHKANNFMQNADLRYVLLAVYLLSIHYRSTDIKIAAQTLDCTAICLQYIWWYFKYPYLIDSQNTNDIQWSCRCQGTADDIDL